MSMFIGLPPRVPLTAWAHGGLKPKDAQMNAFGGYGYAVYGAAISEVEIDVLTGGWVGLLGVC
jgi:xanthine dehydrogenase molybdopterin-binding subunit B